MCNSCTDHSRRRVSPAAHRSHALFRLGRVVATRSVLEHFASNDVDPVPYLRRHQCGDWGDVPSEDARENDRSVVNGFRLLSAYHIAERRCWIITEADRSVTTILFPSEY